MFSERLFLKGVRQRVDQEDTCKGSTGHNVWPQTVRWVPGNYYSNSMAVRGDHSARTPVVTVINCRSLSFLSEIFFYSLSLPFPPFPSPFFSSPLSSWTHMHALSHWSTPWSIPLLLVSSSSTHYPPWWLTPSVCYLPVAAKQPHSLPCFISPC